MLFGGLLAMDGNQSIESMGDGFIEQSGNVIFSVCLCKRQAGELIGRLHALKPVRNHFIFTFFDYVGDTLGFLR